MGKTQCIKDFKCEVCGIPGMLQILSKSYARVRHYRCLKDGKPQFEYHRQSLEYINQHNLDLSGQNTIDLDLNNNGSFTENGWAGSSARIEHRPPKSVIVGSNPTPPVYVHLWFL